nr:hypothetical protein B0A51_12846 [Rachicladosporium sp. CCFEE 5018]
MAFNSTPKTAPPEPIAILGSGCRFPGGADSPAKLWELLKQPRDLLTEIPKGRFNIDAFYHPDGTHPGSTNVRHSYFLEENIHAFDATFFGIKPSEADCIDPQHRILLETVFEALSNARQKLETLAGSQTAVYCGLMCNDHGDNIKQDLNAAPIYSATGTAASILSNRVSYFFDWHGPSMTIDTACSSSLVAVHHAVQQLRSGQSDVAVAAGANLILGPGAYVLESKLNMLSPDGRSRMWDAAANGYARGEGVAAVVLKTLSKAIRDGDHIDCIIRETGINQDGRSPGITMPNHAAQTALIRDTYARAGLDAANPLQRCQYFEAHGTGTPAGDPQEAEAIDTAFFPKRSRAPNEEPLYVGSIKTVIGHTEGTAGIAGLMKASSALQSATIPPNMLFDNLAPRVAPFYKDVRIVTRAQAWPAVVPGAPRRASVNSFGFGGTNAHAILESFEATETTTTHSSGDTSVLPLVVSANTERTLKANLEAILGYLEDNSRSININALAKTLFLQRSTMSLRVSLPAIDRGAAIRSISSELIAMDKKSGTALRSDAVTCAPSILGIFTGQGAQWPTMGKGLITQFSRAHTFVKDLDRSLQTLPIEYRPCWTIEEQLQLEDAQSNVLDAEYSQPLCCAVQLILIDLLTTAGVHFKAVVGHSSGEIACAFAAGFLTSSQAIRVAHLRGLTSKLASSPSGAAGSMLASGTSLEDAHEICALDMFEGRLCVAASNSPSSVTFSGDTDAILELKDMLDDESTFARLLKVDKAYHSHHMLSCAEAYITAMQSCVPRVALDQSIPHPAWLSSVHQGKIMGAEDVTATYWRDNLISPVLFSQAVEKAVVDFDPLEMAIEVGCHPALKGPCLATIQAAVNMELPYVGCMERKGNDILAFQAALGLLWQRSGPAGFDATHWLSVMSPRATAESTTKSLPRYAWDHSKTYSIESRATRNHLHDTSERHPLLGKLSGNSTSSSLQWHQYLRQRDISWLDGHQLQGQTVFPGAGYAVMAMEAAEHVADGRPIRLLEILDLSIGKAITFDDEDSMVELQFIMSALPEQTSNTLALQFSCDSCLAKEQQLSWSAGGKIVITLGEPNADALPKGTVEPPHMNSVYIDAFYAELAALGYGYTKDFRGLQTVKRADKQSRGTIKLATFSENERSLILHPATLDVAFQAFIGAFMYPGDGSLTSLHVPVAIGRIAVNPYLIAQAHADAKDIHFSSAIAPNLRQMIGGDVELTTDDFATLLQVEGFRFKPFSPPTADDDKKLFQKWVWGPYDVDTMLSKPELRASDTEKKAAYDLERLVFYYVRSYLERRSTLVPADSMPAYMEYYDRWCTHVLATAHSGGHPWYESSWEQDTADLVAVVCESVIGIPDTEIIRRTGEYLLAGNIDPGSFFEVLNYDGLLTTFYETNMSSKPGNSLMVDLVRQLSHRYQNMDILEIGGGTGGATKHVIKGCEGAFNSYMFTDISADFFESAKSIFPGELGDRADFATLDITSEPLAQGFSAASYDLVIAANVLHATPDLSKTLRNVRTMMKPGGRLILLELTNPTSFRSGFVFGLFSGWWAGVEEGRALEPFVTIDQWSALMQDAGFTAVNCKSEDADSPEFPVSLFSAQAVSERTVPLLNPLAQISEKFESPLVIIGGFTARTADIVDEIQDTLPARHVSVVKRWEDLLEADIPTKATFLILADIDQQLFDSLEEDNFEAVKMLLFSAANILWITDSVVEKPYHAVSIGFLRSLRLEYNDVNIQALELDGPCERASDILLSALVRLESERVWVPEGIVWTTEPELSLKDGRLAIPRLMTDAVRNDRLNSGRRNIETIHERGSLNVALIRDEQVSYLTKVLDTGASHRSAFTAEKVDLQVLQSSSHAIKIGTEGYFYVVKGRRDDGKAPVIALTNSIASTVAVSPDAVSSPKQELSVLDVVMEAVSTTILDGLTAGVAVVVLNTPDALIQPLLRRAREVKVTVRMLSSTGITKNGGAALTLALHEKELNTDIVRKFPQALARSIDLSGTTSGPTGIAARVTELLPSSCRSRLRFADLFSLSPTTVSPAGAEDLAAAAAAIVVRAQPDDHAQDETVSLSSAVDNTNVVPVHAIDWTKEATVTLRAEPIDTGALFSTDKTYLLVGLAGDMGRSLCRWMIQHGARCIVLTSRNPSIDPRWLDNMRELGGDVVVQDVTKKESVKNGLAAISERMPAVGGIAFGPLVLQDSLFENMELDMMELVLAPKIQGAKNLHEIFSDPEDPLEFFVMFSSLVMVGGNPGQSNYSAANAYLSSLTAQRRARGLAGSSMNIGAVYGVGFIAKAAREEDYTISRYMFEPLSESNLHTQFAEAVVAGRPGSSEALEITTGMPFMDHIHRDHLPYFDDPRLSHFKLPNRKGRASDSSGDVSGRGSIKERLMRASDIDAAIAAIQDGLIDKLHIALQLAAEDTLDSTVALVDQGVDSLVAVTIRTWFSKELGLDMPVLKVLGGASVDDLAQDAAGRLGPELVPALPAGTMELSDGIVDLTPDDSDTETTIPTGSSGSSDIDTLDAAVLSAVLTPPTFYGSLDAGQEKANPFELLSIEEPEVTREEVMSFGQARFWLMRHLVDDPSAFNVTVGLWMTGQISLERLGDAVNAAVQRHETYRTRFYEPEGRPDRPMQAVPRQTRMKFENVAVRDKEAALEGFRAMEHHVYDLVTGDTTRVVDFPWAENQHFLVIAYHHIVSDGWSYEMLFNEIAKIYAGESLPPAPQYADFAARQRLEYDNGLMESDLAYWDAQYRTLPPVLSLLPLSQTKTRSKAVAWSYHEDTVRLQPMVAARIKDRSRKHKATPIHFYLAAFHVLLARLTGNDDIVIGVSDANRTSLDDISTCGFYINLLPIRQQYDTASTFGGAITQAKTQIQDALLHSKPTFDLLLQRLNIARASTHSPLFQVGFDYKQGQAESGRIGGADITEVLMSRSRTAYDITLEVLDDPSKDPMITFKLQSSVYAKEDVKPLLKSYVNLVTAFSRNPALRVEEVQLFSRSELTKSLQLGKGPTVPTHWEPTMIDRLIAHAAVAPNDIALASPDTSLTYAALTDKINNIAAHLQSVGVKAGSKVLSTLSPTVDWICAFYAVMKCGAVYCPVDPTHPATRLATIFEDCQPAAVFIDANLAVDSLPTHKAAIVRIDEVSKVAETIPCQASAEAACVVLYTSGTTGVPKGHILSHAGILNNVEGTYRLLGAVSQRVLQHSAQTFDMSIWQALLGPATGGMTFVVPAESRRDSHKISAIIAEQKITCTVATPLEYSSWISIGSEHLKSAAPYTSALTGGEALSTTVLEQFRSLHLQDLKVFNSYGPAETCFYSSAIEIDYRSALPERLPLGHTIPNYSVYILDEERRPVAPGFPGDIFIGGPSVGLGYLNRPDLTAAAFIPDTFSSADEEAQGHHTLFCTGDRGRLRSDGALLFDGRGGEATQIKLRGMRVELTDIESSILATSEGALTEAICSLRGEGEAAYLVAHVVFTPTHPPADRAGFLRRLRNSIPVPGYMRPAMMLELVSLPLTQHFKVDRRAIAMLPLPENTLATRDSLSGLTTDEAWLWGIWSEVLASEVVASVTPTAEVDFIEAGGNSILIVQLHALLQQSIGVRMPLVEMFENTALGEMAEMVQMHREGKE